MITTVLVIAIGLAVVAFAVAMLRSDLSRGSYYSRPPRSHRGRH